MPIYRIAPQPPLDSHIQWLWYYSDFQSDHEREHVLPDGGFELIINLEDRARKLFDRENIARYQSFRRGWVSGAQSEHLVIDALRGSTMIGAHFRPGGATALLGFPASEMTGKVVELDALWGAEALDWREQLLAAHGPRGKFSVFQRLLGERLAATSDRWKRSRGVSYAIDRFVRAPHLRNVGAVVQELGVSHKHFIDCFRREVGLTPKTFCRIRRFQDVLERIQSSRTVDWADTACACGYFDQAHFVNDFVAFAGMNPSAYLDRRLERDHNFARR